MGHKQDDGGILGVGEQSMNKSKRRMMFSYQRDVPLLRCVRDATFISKDQLVSVVTRAKIEHNRRCLSWRIARLAQNDLVRTMSSILPYKGEVYALTRFGLEVLESCGEGLLNVTSQSRSLPHDNRAAHYLELNDIRGVFENVGFLKRWRTEGELTSINLLGDEPLAKDYDGIADIQVGAKTFHLAIEHERSLKSSARYKDVNESLAAETRVNAVLYFTSSPTMVMKLAEQFPAPKLPICFIGSWMFKQHMFATNVVYRHGPMMEARPLNAVLGAL